MNEQRAPKLHIIADAQDTPRKVQQERRQLEDELAQANSKHWHECPVWLKRSISLLAEFITVEPLQRDILALDQSKGSAVLQEFVDNEPADEAYIATALEQAIADIDAKEARMEKADPAEQSDSESGEGSWHDDGSNDYHNTEHDRQVARRLGKLMRASVPPPTKQEVRVRFMAAVYHDDEHPSGPAIIRDGLSYEQNTVTTVDAMAIKQGMNIYERILLATTILGTTFADKIKPTNQSELMLKLADIGGYMESCEEWIRQSLAVPKEAIKACERRIITKAEIPPYMKAWMDQPDFESAQAAWLVGQQNFIDFELRLNHKRYKSEYIQADHWDIDPLLDEKEQLVKALQGTQNPPASLLIGEMNRINQSIDSQLRQIWERYHELREPSQ